jgi:hypothetical protein
MQYEVRQNVDHRVRLDLSSVRQMPDCQLVPVACWDLSTWRRFVVIFICTIHSTCVDVCMYSISKLRWIWHVDSGYLSKKSFFDSFMMTWWWAMGLSRIGAWLIPFHLKIGTVLQLQLTELKKDPWFYTLHKYFAIGPKTQRNLLGVIVEYRWYSYVHRYILQSESASPWFLLLLVSRLCVLDSV